MFEATVNHEVWESLYSRGHRLDYPSDMFVRVTYRLLDVRRHPRVLDYGFGSGENLMHLCRRGFSMTGVEVSHSALAVTSERLYSAGLDADLHICMDGKLPFKDASFDAITAWQVLCYNDDAGFRKALAELHRVLRPGGLFIAAITAPGDSRQDGAEVLGQGVFRIGCQGQEGAVLRVLEERELSSYFDCSECEIGSFSHEFLGICSRHWIVHYEK